MGPDGKPLRTLFLTLEDTLITEEWDKVNGERQAKRPGVDKMLMYLSSMYEIYIVSDKDMTFGMETVTQLDKNHVCSGYLFSDSMKLRNGTRVKDISYFSRDPKRVVIVDDNLSANEQPENVLVVSPLLEPPPRPLVSETLREVVEGDSEVRRLRRELAAAAGDAGRQSELSRRLCERRVIVRRGEGEEGE